MTGLGPMELIIILMIASLGGLGLILPVIAFWKICSRVGFPGPLGLLMLVPIANIILPLYVAFALWPAFKQEQNQGIPAE
jgi:hypothetical protein